MESISASSMRFEASAGTFLKSTVPSRSTLYSFISMYSPLSYLSFASYRPLMPIVPSKSQKGTYTPCISSTLLDATKSLGMSFLF